jgi:hypothetical protein
MRLDSPFFLRVNFEIIQNRVKARKNLSGRALYLSRTSSRCGGMSSGPQLKSTRIRSNIEAWNL